MEQPHDNEAGIALIAGLAAAIRRALGDDVEACPGRHDPDEAEPLNRAFRALARHVLQDRLAPGADLAAEVRRALLRVARDRLRDGGLDELQARALLDSEPGTPDDWLAFVILVPWREVLFWLGPEGRDPD